MMEKPPIQGVKGVNLTKGKIMLERKMMRREYNGQTAAVGDRVFRRNGAEGEVVYVSEGQFVIESEGRLLVYRKDLRDRLWGVADYIQVNGFLVPAPAEQFAEDLVYIADPGEGEFHYSYLISYSISQKTKLLFARGLTHRSAANAIAHAKAMIGIDPYVREPLDDAWDERPVPPAGEALPRLRGYAAYPTPPEGSSL